MADRILFQTGLNLTNGGTPPTGFNYVGYDGLTFSEYDENGNVNPIGMGGGASSLSQVLSTGNQTSGSDIIVNDNDMVTFNGGSTILLNDTSYITTQGSGSTTPITFNRDGNEFIVKEQGGVLGIYNLATYSSIFDKGEILLANKPNVVGQLYTGLAVTQAPDDNTSGAVTYVETRTKHKFQNLTIRTNGGNYNQSGRVFNEANPSVNDISSSLYYNSQLTVNLPSGAQICNSIPSCAGGDYFKVLVINAGVSSVTFNPGSNTSFPISGQNILAASSCKELLFQVTNATNKTVEIFQM
jgi:hypothetical protein